MPGWPTVGRTDDQRLVEALRRADTADPVAPASLYDSYAERLNDYAHSLLGDRETAAGAVHDALVTARGSVDRLREPGRLRAWLYALVRIRCADAGRGGPRGAVPPPDIHDDPGERELAVLVHEAMAELSVQEREVLELSLRHDLGSGEVGAVLGLTSRQVTARLGRARDHLENAAGAVVLAKVGRAHCPDLSAMVDSWEGPLTTMLRRRLSAHIGRCEVCLERRDRHVSAGRLLDLVPLTYPPLSLRRRVIETCVNPESREERAAIAAENGFDKAGFPTAAEQRSAGRRWGGRRSAGGRRARDEKTSESAATPPTGTRARHAAPPADPGTPPTGARASQAGATGAEARYEYEEERAGHTGGHTAARTRSPEGGSGTTWRGPENQGGPHRTGGGPHRAEGGPAPRYVLPSPSAGEPGRAAPWTNTTNTTDTEARPASRQADGEARHTPPPVNIEVWPAPPVSAKAWPTPTENAEAWPAPPADDEAWRTTPPTNDQAWQTTPSTGNQAWQATPTENQAWEGAPSANEQAWHASWPVDDESWRTPPNGGAEARHTPPAGTPEARRTASREDPEARRTSSAEYGEVRRAALPGGGKRGTEALPAQRRRRRGRRGPVLLAAVCVLAATGAVVVVGGGDLAGGELRDPQTAPGPEPALITLEPEPAPEPDPLSEDPGTAPTPTPTRSRRSEAPATPAPTATAARPAPSRATTAGRPRPTRTATTPPVTGRLNVSCPRDIGEGAGQIRLAARGATVSWSATTSGGLAVHPVRGQLKAGASGVIWVTAKDPSESGAGRVAFKSAGGNAGCAISWESPDPDASAPPEDPAPEPTPTPSAGAGSEEATG
ncbi:sigma factor-like helix-turn-helix DNA-binding protein [Streptosporangium sp. NPDC049046]|uniref:sigma factor-like helix-turn-helix DNA-binding protein n=1 Tax=Streptosporangium sp. NPDC049046 TaxID=3155031 RepID=UPI0034487AEB